MSEEAKSPTGAANEIKQTTIKKKKSPVTKTKPTDHKHAQISSEDFPRRTLESAIKMAKVIRDTYASAPTTWKEIATALGVSEANPVNKYPLWAACAYGIIKRSADNTYTLAEIGRKIIAPNYEGEREEGIRKALFTPAVLSKLYTDYNKSTLPTPELFPNVLENRYNIPRGRTSESIEIIKENAIFAGAIKIRDNREYLDFESASAPQLSPEPSDLKYEEQALPASLEGVKSTAFDQICFIITPIGSENSDERRHSDAMLKHLIEPVLEKLKLRAIRADKISKPGIITQQIIEYIARSKLCIADLSFSNPNAFYELGVRHAFKLSTVQIIRKGDRIPFDVSQGRTIMIDTSDPYAILDKIESGKNELKEHLESILAGSDKAEDNPINLYLPGLKVSIPK